MSLSSIIDLSPAHRWHWIYLITDGIPDWGNASAAAQCERLRLLCLIGLLRAVPEPYALHALKSQIL